MCANARSRLRRSSRQASAAASSHIDNAIIAILFRARSAAEFWHVADSSAKTAAGRPRRGITMASCPECDADIEVDEFDVDKGDQLSCPECGTNLEVTGLSPIELEVAPEDEDEDDEDEDDDVVDDDDEVDVDDVEKDDDKDEDWDE
jgi:alpha-aminoadipate carrier protein LysW